jgi:GAG-pre-integrase domain
LITQKRYFSTKMDDEVLWHKRIGHPCNRVLKLLFNFLKLDCKQCEVCNLAKHTRLPFVSSNTKSMKPFELIHSDAWGPAPLDSYDRFKGKLVSCHLKTLNLAKCHFKTLTPSNATLK